MCNAGALRPFRARFDPTLSDGSHPNFYIIGQCNPFARGGIVPLWRTSTLTFAPTA